MYKSRKESNSGFTLIELLIVIAIIGVLSSMALGVMAKAQDDARASATQARILQIESLLAIQMEDYEVRRLPISTRELGDYVDANPIRGLNAQGRANEKYAQVQNLRRRILQDIINSENPRPFLDAGVLLANDDVGLFPSKNGPFGSVVAGGFDGWLRVNYPNPVDGVELQLRLVQVTPAKVQSYIPMKYGPSLALTDPEFDLPGEYVYQILARMDVDGTPATELLGNATIGNSDDDGYPEVVDAWGDPMLLRIWQIESDPRTNSTDPSGGSGDLYGDQATDFESLNGTSGGPTGYIGLDPTIPRELHKIRMEVISTRLGRHF